MSASAAESDQMLETKQNGMVAQMSAAEMIFQVHLFKTNVANTPASVTADFTMCDFTGSHYLAAHPADFGSSTVTDHVATVLSSVILTWTNAGAAQFVYGYVVLLEGDSTYFFGETFATPTNLLTGQSISVQLRLKDRSNMF